MLNIFQKKEYLKDLISGGIDIHNHILPGIDDGAANVEEAINLLKKYKEIGIYSFIATPHVMNDYYPNTPATIEQALERTLERIENEPELKQIKIRAAAEYMMDQSFLELMEEERLLTLKEKFVLVEMSYFQAPINLNEILFKLQTMGYKPILAHPERYAFFHSKDLKKYDDLKSRGCLFQLNALALSSHYGLSMQQAAYNLLERGMFDFIGGDTHRLQHLEKLEQVKIKKKHVPLLKVVIENTRATFQY